MARLARPRAGGQPMLLQLPGRGPAWQPASPCATCGICCRSYLVPLCGRDIWLLSRELDLPPARFVVAWQEEEPVLDGFRLEPAGPTFSLVLDKRSWSRSESACTFLLRLPGGNDRCGVYAHRPVSCRAYPITLAGSAVVLRDDPLCPTGAWPDDEPARPGWRAALQAAHMQFDVYAAAVARWNGALVGRAEPAEYYDWLLRAYDAIAALEAELGAEALAALEAGWRAPGGDVHALPWQAHLERVRASVAGP